MPRVRFKVTTERYAKGAVILLGDKEAKLAVDAGHVDVLPDPMEVGNKKIPGSKVMRVKFKKNWIATDGRKFIPTAIATIDEDVAKKAISDGCAIEYPWAMVGNEAPEIQSARNRRAGVAQAGMVPA